MALLALHSDLPPHLHFHDPVVRLYTTSNFPSDFQMSSSPVSTDRRYLVEHDENGISDHFTFRPLEEHYLIAPYADKANPDPVNTTIYNGPLSTNTRKILTGLSILALVFLITDGGRGF
jgi:hypothetical protein